MDTRTVFFASYELLLSIVFGLGTVLITIKAIGVLFIRGKFDEDKLVDNVSISLFYGAMVICVLILVSSSITPSVDALRTMVLARDAITAGMVLISLGYFLAFFAVSLAISMALLFLGAHAYLWATADVDEMAEIRRNNIAVSVLLSGVLLGLTLFVYPPLHRFMASLVDYQVLERKEQAATPRAPEAGQFIVPEQRHTPRQAPRG